jgi:hypothetical protein
MNTSGEAADQIVRMSLNGVEVAAKITGAGAKQLAVMLYAIMKDHQPIWSLALSFSVTPCFSAISRVNFSIISLELTSISTK